MYTSELSSSLDVTLTSTEQNYLMVKWSIPVCNMHLLSAVVDHYILYICSSPDCTGELIVLCLLVCWLHIVRLLARRYRDVTISGAGLALMTFELGWVFIVSHLTRGLGFCGLIQRIAPFSCSTQQTRGTYSKPDPRGHMLKDVFLYNLIVCRQFQHVWIRVSIHRFNISCCQIKMCRIYFRIFILF